MSKRVILFGPLPPPYGGVSVFLSSLVEHLKDAPIHVWAYFGANNNGTRSTHFNHRRLGVISALIRQGYKSRIVDFTHFHLEYPHSILLPIWLYAKSLFGFEWIKYILDGSLPQRFREFQPAQRRRFEKALSRIDEFIVVSDELRLWLIDELKVTKRITVIPCLLNIPSEFRKTTLSSETNKALQQFCKHEKRVCSIGTFIPHYGFQHVAEAIERLRAETNVDVGLLLLDGSFADDADYRKRVLADRDWITVMTNVPNPEIYQILPNCQLFVRSVEAESYGISRVEAIWCGVPVIGVAVGETRGVLTYSFGDVERLKALVKGVLSGEQDVDLQHWSNLFHAEADEHLSRFIETVKIDYELKGVVRSAVATNSDLPTNVETI